MAQSFVQANPDFFFGPQPYPGAGAFKTALDFYRNQLLQSNAGNGLGALVGAQVADPLAQQYNQVPYSPDGSGTAQAENVFSGLMKGLNSPAIGQAESSEMLNSLQGAAQSGSDYSQSMANAIRGNIVFNQAQGQKAEGMLGNITDILSNATQGAIKGFELGGPYGALAGGAGGAALGAGQGFGGMGNNFSIGGLGLNSLLGSSGGTVDPGPLTSAAPTNMPSGYTAVNPNVSNTFAPSSLPPGIDPSQIAGYSPDASASPGIFSSLINPISNWWSNWGAYGN